MKIHRLRLDQSLSRLGTPPETLVITAKPLPEHFLFATCLRDSSVQTVWTARACITSRMGEGLQVGKESNFFGNTTAALAEACLHWCMAKRSHVRVWHNDLARWSLGSLVAGDSIGLLQFEDEILRYLKRRKSDISTGFVIDDRHQSKKLCVRFQV